MKIYLRELTELDTELDFTQEETWVNDAVLRVDEQLDEELHGKGPTLTRAATKKPRAIEAHFNLRMIDEVAMVSGSVKTQVELYCSRCANAFAFPVDTRFDTLFCRDPEMAGVGHMTEKGDKPAGQNKGHARHAHDYTADGSKDIDITYLSEDFIDLGEVLTEQLQLQVPFQPLCKEACKGMCLQCGADLNVGRCACAKLNKSSPFSVLKDLKV